MAVTHACKKDDRFQSRFLPKQTLINHGTVSHSLDDIDFIQASQIRLNLVFHEAMEFLGHL